MGTKSYIGKGTIYVKDKASSLGFLTLGNCSELTLTINEDKKEQKDFEDAGGAIVDSVSRIESVVANLIALNLTASNVKLALRGGVTTVSTSVISIETQVGDVGALIPFDFLPDLTVTPVITGASATPVFVEGTDYRVVNSGIVAIEGGGITAALPLEVSYTSLDSHEIEALVDSSREYEVYFDGLNEAESGLPVTVRFHRVKFNPTQTLELIGDDFASLAMTYDVLKDSSIVGAGLSKFLKIQQSQ